MSLCYGTLVTGAESIMRMFQGCYTKVAPDLRTLAKEHSTIPARLSKWPIRLVLHDKATSNQLEKENERKNKKTKEKASSGRSPRRPGAHSKLLIPYQYIQVQYRNACHRAKVGPMASVFLLRAACRESLGP